MDQGVLVPDEVVVEMVTPPFHTTAHSFHSHQLTPSPPPAPVNVH